VKWRSCSPRKRQRQRSRGGLKQSPRYEGIDGIPRRSAGICRSRLPNLPFHAPVGPRQGSGHHMERSPSWFQGPIEELNKRFQMRFLCGTLCGKNFQDLLKYDSEDKIYKIETKKFK
jgi:hypothetical protein